VGPGPEKTLFLSNIPFIYDSFPIFQCRRPSADACDASQRMKQRAANGSDRINKIHRIE
jgi:hypothetical protein